ncbi:MAG: hypothetical protein U0163_10270 [Gemmatimonadaceae bacterium]
MFTLRSPNVAFGAVVVGIALGSQGRRDAQLPASEPRFLATDVTKWIKVGGDGALRMNLVGRSTPSPTELITFRERYPATFMCDSTAIKVQRHLGTQHILVLRGTLILGFGDTVNYARAEQYGPGSHVMIASGDPHFEWNRGELEIQVTAVGMPRIPTFRRIDRTISEPSPTTFIAAPCTPSRPDAPPAPAAGLPERPPNATRGNFPIAGDQKSPTDLRLFLWMLPSGGLDSSRAVFHYHWGTEHVTMRRGTMRIALGFPTDYSKAKAYGPGSFVEIPAGMPHLEWFEPGDAEAIVAFVGPSSAVNLDLKTGHAR